MLEIRDGAPLPRLAVVPDRRRSQRPLEARTHPLRPHGRQPPPRSEAVKGSIPDSEWARALESEGSPASRIRNLEGRLPFLHRLSDGRIDAIHEPSGGADDLRPVG